MSAGAALALAAGCAKAGLSAGTGPDDEIVHKIVLKLCEDTRFADVTVACLDGYVTLGGTAEDLAAASDAVKVAAAVTRNARVTCRIGIRPGQRE